MPASPACSVALCLVYGACFDFHDCVGWRGFVAVGEVHGGTGGELWLFFRIIDGPM